MRNIKKKLPKIGRPSALSEDLAGLYLYFIRIDIGYECIVFSCSVEVKLILIFSYQAEAKSSAYGELGCLHSLLGNFEQAITCLQHQVAIAREKGDRVGEGEAVCGLGGVYQHMGEFDKALEHHQLDLQIALGTGSAICQCE